MSARRWRAALLTLVVGGEKRTTAQEALTQRNRDLNLTVTNKRSSVKELPVLKVLALIKRKPEMSRDEFLRYWEERHAPLILDLPGVRRYRQNHAIEHHTQWPYDGAAEVWFDSVGDVARAFEGPAADAMRVDEENFVGDIVWFLVNEHEIELEGERQ
jgi:uncharacterized protein (TIGR02118 family)